jgi:glutamate-ammonia-ligase adenylyltransferase
LRIGLRDVANLSEVHETQREITCLAEACLVAGVSAACEEAGLDPSGLAVVGLGSFGGYELHFSSDLDVVFALAPDQEARAGEAFSRAMRAVLKAFSEPTVEGPLFAVDARLRPEGQNGPLVPAWSAIETYMRGRGQAWERIASTRARPLRPACEATERLAAAYADFAYCAPLTAEERAEVDRIRARIEQERERSDEEQLDLKLCRGGLIDLEFAVRIAQIEAGAQMRSIRTPGLREAIRLLARVRAIPPALSESLSRAWRLLRGLEMRLQVVHDEPSGVLDMSDAALAMMGRKLHISVSQTPLSGDELRERLSAARSIVRDTYERVVDGGTDALRARSTTP